MLFGCEDIRPQLVQKNWEIPSLIFKLNFEFRAVMPRKLTLEAKTIQS